MEAPAAEEDVIMGEASSSSVGMKMNFTVKMDSRNLRPATAALKAFASAAGDEEKKRSSSSKKGGPPLVIPLTTNKWGSGGGTLRKRYKPDEDDLDEEEEDVVIVKEEEMPAVKMEEEEDEPPSSSGAVRRRVKTEDDDEAAALAALVADAGEPREDAKKPSLELTIPMGQQSSSSGNNQTEGEESSAVATAAPLLVACSMPGLDDIADEGDKFKYDISMRADDFEATSESYSSVPIEEFGLAMLRGMGWAGYTKDDEERYKKGVEARPGRLGLGAQKKPSQVYDKRGNLRTGRTATNKDADKAFQKEQAENATSKRKWLGAQSKPASQRRALEPGVVVDITGGHKHAGRRAKVVAASDLLIPNNALLLLERTKSAKKPPVSVPHHNITIASDASVQETPFVDYLESSSSSSKKSRDDEEPAKKKKKKEKKPAEKPPWLCEGIRVRVNKGEHFRKKGLVVDIIRGESGALNATLQLESGLLLSSMSESFLETVLPSKGGPIKVVAGEKKGKLGVLHDRDKKKEKAFVMLENDGPEIRSLDMNDVAEWCIDNNLL